MMHHYNVRFEILPFLKKYITFFLLFRFHKLRAFTCKVDHLSPELFRPQVKAFGYVRGLDNLNKSIVIINDRLYVYTGCFIHIFPFHIK